MDRRRHSLFSGEKSRESRSTFNVGANHFGSTFKSKISSGAGDDSKNSSMRSNWRLTLNKV